jgi:hypothetical protein
MTPPTPHTSVAVSARSSELTATEEAAFRPRRGPLLVVVVVVVLTGAGVVFADRWLQATRQHEACELAWAQCSHRCEQALCQQQPYDPRFSRPVDTTPLDRCYRDCMVERCEQIDAFPTSWPVDCAPTASCLMPRTLAARHDASKAAASAVAKIHVDKATFDSMHAADQMANDKLQEGIDGFAKAITDLENELKPRLASI